MAGRIAPSAVMADSRSMKETRVPMKNVPMNHVSLKSRILVAALAAGMLGLSACSSEGPASSASSSGGLSGEIVGSGATSQESAQTTWRSAFTKKQAGIKVSYNGGGSGKGASDFTSGAVAFAGSDDALSLDAMKAGSFAGCAESSNALNLPIYVSPIAMVYNVDGVKSLKLDATTAASIFSGKITKWNDPAIAALNSGETLPDTAITVVHRSDKSGTTENFTDTLSQNASNVWTEKPSQTWPAAYSGESSEGTSGVVAAVKNGTGTIGYADMSQASGLSVVSYGKDGNFVQPTGDEAAKVVSGSPARTGGPANDQAIALDRTQAGYPFVLVSYALVCEQYKDSHTAELVKSYLGYVVSSEGQADAEKSAGSAPLASALAGKVQGSIDSIK